MVKLAEIMTDDVVTTSPETPVADVAAAMVKGRFGSAVVVQGRMIVGIVTERDVLRAAASREDMGTAPVSRWMTHHPETVGPDIDSNEAEERMLGGGFRHLPVVDGNDLVGIVSLRDLLSARIRRSVR
jgi:CBS domain-containing protein